MAELSLHRGEKSKVENLPIKNGQVLIGTISDKIAAIYIDTINKNEELVRIEVDFSDYTLKIKNLEVAVELINRSIEDGLVVYKILQTADGINIVTNENEEIICSDR